ncbi:MAG: DMT family transporter [Klebsiella michiganensis]|nr:DMT family transporter [Klebsiella michiganensis]
MRDLHKGVWQMSLAMLISGSIGAFVLLSGLPVTEVVFWRCLIGAIALFIFIRMSRKPFSPLTRITLLLAILGGVALVVNWLLLFAAYERISIGLSTVVYNTQPFMLVLMGMLFGERVSIGLALGAAFFYALTAIITRKLKSLAPQHIAFIQVLTGVVMLLPLAHMPSLTPPFPWVMLLTLGIVHTGVMYQLLYSAIQKLPTPIIGSLSFIYPVVAIVVDNRVFGHSLNLIQLFGGALILLAAAGNNLGWGEKKPRQGGVGIKTAN